MPLTSAPHRPVRPIALRTPFLLLAALAALACRSGPTTTTPAATPPPLSIEVVTQDLAAGETRLAFVVLDHGHPIGDAQVHLLFYYLGDAQPKIRAETDAAPYVDRHEHASPADHVDAPFYVTTVIFDQAGPWGMEARLQRPNTGQQVVRLALNVQAQPRAPAIGSPAPRSASKTLRDTPPEQLSSVLPIDPELYALSIDEAIETGKPFLVAFATPAFCTSRTCGPQLHVVEHLKDRYRGAMHFIHVEVYDNPQEVARDYRTARLSPTVQEWRLPSEPWVFLVDRQGLIAARFEGYVTLEELEPAVQRLLQ